MTIFEESGSIGKGRLDNIDALRGVCALLVVFQHVLPLQWLGAGFFQGEESLYLDIGRIGAASFFLVSGYVIPFSIKPTTTLQSFWIARFFRLWPVYLISIFFAVIIGVEAASSLTKFDILINATMLQQFLKIPNVLGVFWTLQIELSFYFILSVMLLLKISNDRKKIDLAMYVFFLLAMIFAVLKFRTNIRFPVAFPLALGFMFFATGLRFRRLNNELFPFGILLIVFFVIVVTSYLGYQVKPMDFFNDNPYRWMLAYSTSVLLFLIFERINFVPKFLVFIGTISYSVYLFHPIVLHFFESTTNIFLRCFLVVMLTMVISALLYYLVEKPCQNFGKKINRTAYFRQDA